MGEIVKDNIPPLLWTEEPKVQPSPPQQLKTTKKRKIRSNKKEFQGWGSKQLVEFLESIGEDTSKQHSQFDVTNIINKYVHDNKLIHSEKKKRIVCDEKLHSLFGRKSVGRIKIYDLLDPHFAENQEEDEEDDKNEELDGNGDGFEDGQIAALVTGHPLVLIKSIKNSLEPRIKFLVEVMGRRIDEVVEYPDFFGHGLKKSLEFRQKLLKQRQINCSLAEMLDCNQKKFLLKFGMLCFWDAI